FLADERRKGKYRTWDSPTVIPFAANYNTNIVIAEAIRDIRAVDMDMTSEKAQDFNFRISRKTKAELESLEFDNFFAAIYDRDFKDLSRLVAFNAWANGLEALAAKSARADVYDAPAYDPKDANILAIFGRDRESFSHLLNGVGLIQIRPGDKGVT